VTTTEPDNYRSEVRDTATRSAAPEILIHMHIPKTGGTSLESMLCHAFKSEEVFDTTIDGNEQYSGLGLASYERCRGQLALYSPEELRRLRYVTGHIPMGIHRLFDRPAKYFTLVRHPVDRVVSHFFFRIQLGKPYLNNGRPLNFEEYVHSRCDLRLTDYQVRIISGNAELDTARQQPAALTPGRPVERYHLEQAKQNIETHFLAAAPLYNLTELGLLIRRIYGWPMRRLLTEYKNPTKRRPRITEISPRLIRIIEDCNVHDLELYEWLGKKFAVQMLQFEPKLTRDRRVFGIASQTLKFAGKALPWSLRKSLARRLLYAQNYTPKN
jgi:hypothetical protein